jgi:protein TonB
MLVTLVQDRDSGGQARTPAGAGSEADRPAATSSDRAPDEAGPEQALPPSQPREEPQTQPVATEIPPSATTAAPDRVDQAVPATEPVRKQPVSVPEPARPAIEDDFLIPRPPVPPSGREIWAQPSLGGATAVAVVPAPKSAEGQSKGTTATTSGTGLAGRQAMRSEGGDPNGGRFGEDGNSGNSGFSHARPVASNPEPRYPRRARRNGQAGHVVLAVDLDAAGQVRKISIARSSGHKILDKAARDAVTKWQFVPARREGRPVPQSVKVPITFRLTD